MGLFNLIVIAIGLSMDSFAVSICKGLTLQKMRWRYAVRAGLFFGFFQGLMPLIGYYLGTYFERFITNVDHWIAFGLLAFLGGKMIYEAWKEKDSQVTCSCSETVQAKEFSFRPMLGAAIATSIDALAVGITFAFLKTNIWVAVLLIGCTTFTFSVAGVRIGNVFGARYKRKAVLAGGFILVLIGLKILLEHL